MQHHDEHSAKELLMKHAMSGQAPERRKAHVHMWVAVGACSAVFVAMYAFVAVRTYDFFEVKRSFAAVVDDVSDFGAKIGPELEKPKMMWTQLKLDLAKEANAKVEADVVDEMKIQMDSRLHGNDN